MSMWWDISLQGLVFLVSIGTYLYMSDYPRKLLDRYHSYRDRNKRQSRLHFVKAADYLSKARSHARSSPRSLSFAASCAAEADNAVKFDPTDAANHIIRALALDLQGFKPSALDAINAALSPLAVGSLSPEEKADALVKRAALRIEVSKVEGDEVVDESIWTVVEGDLKEALELNKESLAAWCMLGDCCEKLAKTEMAAEAFQEALRLNPASNAANQGLQRLASA